LTTLMNGDYLDTILAQWAAERPDLDASPMGVIGRISRLSRVLEFSIEQVFASYDLSRGGFDVLAALRRSGPPYRLSPTELYNSLLISSGAMTNRVDRLEERKLVVRVPDPNDRRGVLVALTGKGRKLVDNVTDAHLENEQRLLVHLSPTERKQLAHLLRKLLMNLDGSHDHQPKEEASRARPVA
jgi:DNA-binding MarR family transcriptional regulator